MKQNNQKPFVKTVYTIAGTDCSGGAGVMADLKTFTALGVYGAAVITNITAQNTCEFINSEPVSLPLIKQQIQAINNDLKCKFLKVGMLQTAPIIKLVSIFLKHNHDLQAIIDPVMVTKNGVAIMDQTAVADFCKYILPNAFMVTPNKYEAEKITGINISQESDIKIVCQKIAQWGSKYVLVTGGHVQEQTKIVNNWLYDATDQKLIKITNARYNQQFTHGTGCSLSAAIAAYLTLDYDVLAAVRKAQNYVAQGIKYGEKIGHGINPINHTWMFDHK